MFDIGFSELLVIALVALVVIGPERLPRVARTAGHLLGRLQRYVSDVKADINREIQLEDLKKMQQEVEESARSLQDGVTQELSSMESALNRALAAADDGVAPVMADAVAPVPAVTDEAAASQLELGFNGDRPADGKPA
ncbi:MAG TPA: Sec-independent protein translocase protein TatB [Candidatus Desulfobacillus sp.]|nr:Sec-independent protein translocase protein TatB [Candidatus Desulfobacillus sp.]